MRYFAQYAERRMLNTTVHIIIVGGATNILRSWFKIKKVKAFLWRVYYRLFTREFDKIKIKDFINEGYYEGNNVWERNNNSK